MCELKKQNNFLNEGGFLLSALKHLKNILLRMIYGGTKLSFQKNESFDNK